MANVTSLSLRDLPLNMAGGPPPEDSFRYSQMTLALSISAAPSVASGSFCGTASAAGSASNTASSANLFSGSFSGTTSIAGTFSGRLARFLAQ